MHRIPPSSELFIRQKDRRTRRLHDPGARQSPVVADGTDVGPADEAERRIRALITDRSFEIHFQPIVDLGTGRHLGTEALSRFPGGLPRGPDRWFAEASAVGLRTELEVTAVDLALAELYRLPDDRFLSVNVSVETLLDDRFRDLVSSVPAEQVVLELTGRPIAPDHGTFARAIADLRAGGVGVAIGDTTFDDTSVRRLFATQPDIVKLDMAPDRGMSPREVLGQALMKFGLELYATTMVAQGIESRGSIDVLRTLGCSVGQGFALARPSPLIAPPTFLLPPPPVAVVVGGGHDVPDEEPADEETLPGAEGPDLPATDGPKPAPAGDVPLLSGMLLAVT